MTYHSRKGESWIERKRRERGERAVERQLEYQKYKSGEISGDERIAILNIKRKAVAVREKLEAFRIFEPDDSVLEVGSGAHGLVFGFDEYLSIGLDPLAVEYKSLFPVWQKESTTIAGIGENLPFDDSTFEVVLSDNVIDHASDPVGIIFELVRVLKPGGILYFSVNTHHPIYQPASVLHGLWNAVGVKYEISPFADHTVHFTERSIRNIFNNLPLNILSTSRPHASGSKSGGSGIEGKIKRIFHKNILFELIATKL